MSQIETARLDETESRLIAGFAQEWLSDAPCIVAHTSGSTGTPKEIMLPKADMRLSARATNARFGIDRRSVMICPLSINYIAGKMMMVRAFESGCRVLFCHPSNRFLSDPEVRAFINRNGAVDLVPVVPSQLSQILEKPALAEGIHNIIIGGAPLAPDVEASLSRLSGSTEYFATYGMTETCSHVALRHAGSPQFTAMPGITFGADHRGCLIINAPQYSFGALTTNDIAEIVDNRTFIWRGRFDNVINSGGIKIFPEELEKQLAPHLAVPFYIVGAPHPKWGSTPVIVAERKPAAADTGPALSADVDTALSDDDISAICAWVLPPRLRPSGVCRVDSLPRTSTGKIRRIPPSRFSSDSTDKPTDS